MNTRLVISFSASVRVAQDWMSLETGTFSGSQKLPTRRSQTSRSFSSWSRFQLIADTRSTSFSLPVGSSCRSSLVSSEGVAVSRRHSMQLTQPSTSVPSSAICRRRM